MARTGRRPGASDTRERILSAARSAFAEAGLDRTTMRGIARAAGVDPALVYHYFRSKEHLFAASLELPFDPSVVTGVIVAGNADEVGERLARIAMDLWQNPPTRAVFAGVVRSATSDEQAAAALRSLLESILLPALHGLKVDHPELRGALAWSALVGIFIGRNLIRVGPLAEATPETLEQVMARMLQAAISQPISEPWVAPGGEPVRPR